MKYILLTALAACNIWAQNSGFEHLNREDVFRRSNENRPAISRYINNQPLSTTSKRYVITGGPGVGKTTIINYLENLGYDVVQEAATDLIRKELAENIEAPWSKQDFNEKVAKLQEQRQKEAERSSGNGVFFDRCPVDAISYDLLYDFEPTHPTIRIVQSLIDENYYNKKVFLIENLGSCLQTEVRAETLEQVLKIEDLLEKNYRALGFQIVRIPACPVEDRAKIIQAEIASDSQER